MEKTFLKFIVLAIAIITIEGQGDSTTTAWETTVADTTFVSDSTMLSGTTTPVVGTTLSGTTTPIVATTPVEVTSNAEGTTGGGTTPASNGNTPADVYVAGACFCVPKNTCNLADGSGPSDGSGQLDARIMTVNQSFFRL